MKKNLLLALSMLIAITIFSISCKSNKQGISISDEEEQAFQQVEGDTISISSNKTEYEITIIEPGFYTWLQSVARPENYYSQTFLEARNQIWVVSWNQRVLQPQQFSPQLYEMQIDYQTHIDYGYEVNYKLYNYLVYFQRKYRQRLGTFAPRL